MGKEKDWILTNIENILHKKGLSLENVALDIGISSGEFSKILSGLRKYYYKRLPEIAESLGVSYHELVRESDKSLSDKNEKQESDDNEKQKKQNGILEIIIAELRSVIADLRIERDKWQEKYYRMKEKLELAEEELKNLRSK